ncbi:MAG: LysE family transporter, partial [Saprospiraceae bacterium]
SSRPRRSPSNLDLYPHIVEQHYFTALIQGFPVGFFMSLALGPVIFSIINYSISEGVRAGLWISMGVIIADLLLIAIALTGVQVLMPENLQVEGPVRIAGAVILMAFGLGTLFNKAKKKKAKEEEPQHFSNIVSFVGKGFLLNILNPANLVLWLGANSFAKTGMKYSLSETLWFFGGALIAIFVTEVSVAFFAVKVKRFLHEKVLKGINLLTGLIFLGTGIYLLIKPWIDPLI